MSKLKMFALATVAVLGLTGSANAATPMLETGDFVGISFWLVSMGMIATTVPSNCSVAVRFTVCLSSLYIN